MHGTMCFKKKIADLMLVTVFLRNETLLPLHCRRFFPPLTPGNVVCINLKQPTFLPCKCLYNAYFPITTTKILRYVPCERMDRPMFRTILNYHIHVQCEISISNGLPMKVTVFRDVTMHSLVQI